MRATINDRDFEQLSAYMDGQLAPAEVRKLEERLRVRPDLQEALEDLRRTRALLRAAPRRRAPRNFTLTPAMVGEQAGRRRGGFFNNLFPTLSFASAIATFALIASLLFDLAPGTAPAATTAMEAPAAAQEMTREMPQASPAGSGPGNPAIAAAPQMGSAAKSEGAPPVIMWGPSVGTGGGSGIAPGCPDGRCGGAADPGMAWGMGGGGGLGGGGELGGMGGGAGDGTISIPAESVDAMSDTAAAPEIVEPNPAITGSGPILGVPAAEQSGEILEREAINQGLPAEQRPAPVAGEQPPAEPSAAQPQPAAQPLVLGLPPLRLAQILLGVLAIATGLAAFILRRR